MKKMIWVDFELAPYRNAEDELPENLRDLREAMSVLVEMVVAVEDDKFAISKNMLLALYLVFNPASVEDVTQYLPKQLITSYDFNELIHKLGDMCADGQCKDVLSNVHGSYADSCSRLAEAHEAYVYNSTSASALLFKNNSQCVQPFDREEELEKENKFAREQRNEVFGFCDKFKLKM